jgi:hypothetical protein
VHILTAMAENESIVKNENNAEWQGWNLRRGGSTCLSIDFPGVLTVPSFMLI